MPKLTHLFPPALFAIGTTLLVGCISAEISSHAPPPALVAVSASATPAISALPQADLPTPTTSAPNYCLACHTDKQQLIDTAKPEEPEAESESSGVG